MPIKGITNEGEYVTEAYQRLISKKTYFIENLLGKSIDTLIKETNQVSSSQGLNLGQAIKPIILSAKDTLTFKCNTEAAYSGEFKVNNLLFAIYRLNENFVVAETDDYCYIYNKDENKKQFSEIIPINLN